MGLSLRTAYLEICAPQLRAKRSFKLILDPVSDFFNAVFCRLPELIPELRQIFERFLTSLIRGSGREAIQEIAPESLSIFAFPELLVPLAQHFNREDMLPKKLV